MLYKLVFGDAYSFRRAVLTLLVLLIPSVIFVTNSLVWDDINIIKHHAHWTVEAMFGRFLSGHSAYWRPVTVWTIALPYLLGLPVWCSKLISLLLFFAKGTLALAIADTCLRARGMATSNVPLMTLAALFALHPIFVESAFWISARGDLLLGICVLAGALDLVRYSAAQVGALAPPSPGRRFMFWFALVVIGCGTKDTGFVCAAACIPLLAGLGLRGEPAWRRAWRIAAAGAFAGCALMTIARLTMLPAPNGPVTMALRHSSTGSEALGVFTEFMVRALANMVVPLADQSPFKATGWLSGVPDAILFPALAVALVASAWLAIRILRANPIAALLGVGGFGLLVFHALLAVYTEPTIGTVFNPRYADISVALFLISLTILLPRPLAASGPDRSAVNWSVAILFAVMLAQSLLTWTTARAAWQNNATLWDTAWERGAHARQVQYHLALALAVRDQFSFARELANDFEKNKPDARFTDNDCMMDMIMLDADAVLADPARGANDAWHALPFAHCSFNLAHSVAVNLLNEHCQDVLPMLRRTMQVSDALRAANDLLVVSVPAKLQATIDAADAENRCGDPAQVRPLLEAAAKMDPSWAWGTVKAQDLIHRATTSTIP